MKLPFSLSGSFLLVIVSALGVRGPARSLHLQGPRQLDGPTRPQAQEKEGLGADLESLRSNAAKLESALKKQHQSEPNLTNSGGDRARSTSPEQKAKSTPQEAESKMKPGGMQKMKATQAADDGAPKKKMGMGMGMMPSKDKKKGMGMMGGKGMGMMGRMPKMAMSEMPTALPGFPGASHLYHIGATSLFLDHDEHITLSKKQETQLNKLKEKALLSQASSTRQIEEAEQSLWVLTGSDEPDAPKIEAQIRKIAKLESDQRIAFIRAVGEAAKILTPAQRQALAGQGMPSSKLGNTSSNSSTPQGSNE